MVIAVKSNPVRYMMDKTEDSGESINKIDCSEKERYCDSASSKAGTQEFVGNCKEFRIDNNKTHLKIIGNGNKIRLASNTGHLEVIGNATRVKISKNNGSISYTGNSGKVYLGSDSSNKHVDYIGNSGVLKVVPEENLNVGSKKTSEDYKKIQLGTVVSSPKSESNWNSLSSVKIQTGSSTSTEIHFDPSGGLRLQLKNNPPKPSVDVINFATGNASNSVQITSSSGNITVNNSFKV